MIVLKSIDVFYGHIHALRRASLHVKQGEIVALIGSNGAGKTTLLTTISGLPRPATGQVVFQGRDISRASPDRIVHLGVSQVPEGRLVFKPMTVEDNLLLGSYSRQQGQEVQKDLEDMFDFFPVLRERRKQMAPTITREIFKRIVQLRNALDLTVLLVEQNARSALRIADRGYVLETGRIILQGPAEELLANKDVQRAYLGRDLE